MRIKKLTLHNFRNYEDETFAFSDGLNVLTGRNAQGKTNCAEAVFYLCTGSSLRIRHDRQLIRRGESCASLRAEGESRFGTLTLEADIFENKRELRVNGIRVKKSADFLGNINSVFFSPGELRLIQDGPDERRRFLNLSISQTSRSYAQALLRYNKILDQRNNLLKNRDVSLVLDTLPVWDEQLAHYAAVIVRHRAVYLKELSPLRIPSSRTGRRNFPSPLMQTIPRGRRRSRRNLRRSLRPPASATFVSASRRWARTATTSRSPSGERMPAPLPRRGRRARRRSR